MSAKFLVADDYRLSPSYSVPFSKSDDVANERVEVQMHEHLFIDSDIGVVTGSNKDNSEKYETKNNNLPKDWVRLTIQTAESLNYTYSARKHNDLNRSLTF